MAPWWWFYVLCFQCYGGIWRHNTDNINNDTHIGTRCVILAKHCMWLPVDGFMWTETCWNSFYNFNYFNNLRILQFVCISWKIKFLILLMHGATMNFMQWQIKTCTDMNWNLQWRRLTCALTQTETCGAMNRSTRWLNFKKCREKLKNVVTSSETCTCVNWNMSWPTGTCNVINWISSGWGISSCSYVVPESGLRYNKILPLSLSGIVEPQVLKVLNNIIVSFTPRSSRFSVPSKGFFNSFLLYHQSNYRL